MNNLYIGVKRGRKKGLVFRSDVVPTKKMFGRYFDNVIGPFDTLQNVARYCRVRQLSPKLFDPRSFRTILLGSRGKKGVIGCPKGYWDVRRSRCKVGTRLQSILIPEGTKECPKGGMELNNPYTRTGLYYPEKGSPEAYEWARRMRMLKEMRRRGLRNPGAEYHDKKFMEHLRRSGFWKEGTPPYFMEIGKAYAHIESAEDSVESEKRKKYD